MIDQATRYTQDPSARGRPSAGATGCALMTPSSCPNGNSCSTRRALTFKNRRCVPDETHLTESSSVLLRHVGVGLVAGRRDLHLQYEGIALLVELDIAAGGLVQDVGAVFVKHDIVPLGGDPSRWGEWLRALCHLKGQSPCLSSFDPDGDCVFACVGHQVPARRVARGSRDDTNLGGATISAAPESTVMPIVCTGPRS